MFRLNEVTVFQATGSFGSADGVGGEASVRPVYVSADEQHTRDAATNHTSKVVIGDQGGVVYTFTVDV